MSWEYTYIMTENNDYIITENNDYVITNATFARLKEASDADRLKDTSIIDKP